MKKLDREDTILILVSVIMFIASSITLTVGFIEFSGKQWNTLYLISTISCVVLFVFAVLSFVVKKVKEHKK